MNRFRAKVKDNVKKNRLLSITGKSDIPEIEVTKAGGVPDFYSTGELKKGNQVSVNIRNDRMWNIEAGKNIPAGSSVEVGDNGTVVPASNSGIGYVTTAVKKGDLAKVYRRFNGSGNMGNSGITRKQYNDLVKRIEKVEKRLKEGE